MDIRYTVNLSNAGGVFASHTFDSLEHVKDDLTDWVQNIFDDDDCGTTYTLIVDSTNYCKMK